MSLPSCTLPHLPVLRDETIAALHIQPGGRYVDATFGRGGHSTAILAKLNADGQLLALDQDPQAIAAGQALAAQDARLHLYHAAFDSLALHIDKLGWSNQVNGILLDLGLSSPQLDDAQRGFSFQHDGPLDMRMDTTCGEPLWAWLARVDERTLANVIYQYGEERWSRRIARLIVETRTQTPILTTSQLAALVARAQPRVDAHKHPATRTFQALRIFLNRELSQLESVLAQALTVLAPGGRIAVISFHSLEDRIVKQFFRRHAQGDSFPPDLPLLAQEITHPLRLVGKPLQPNPAQIQANSRARSARLRVAEKQSTS